MKPFVKRLRQTKLQELQICDHSCNVLNATYNELAMWAQAKFLLCTKPSKQMIGRILKSEGSLRGMTPDGLRRKKVRPKHQLQLDQCVVEFIAVCEAYQVSLSGYMLVSRGHSIATQLNFPKASQPRFGSSRLRQLQGRHGVRWRRAHGESGTVDLEVFSREIEALRSIISSYAYQDVYNMDETGYFYNNVPRGSICIDAAPARKQDKARITLAVCTNATGTSKLSLLFIGTALKPRWIKRKPAAIIYTATSKAWVTTDKYQAWLLNLDASMHEQGRNILLLVDNASSHCEDGITLTNVRVEKLPPNTTSKLQPLDQGIIYCLKREVLNKKMKYALDQMDEGDENPYKIGMLKVIQWCADAWEKKSCKDDRKLLVALRTDQKG